MKKNKSILKISLLLALFFIGTKAHAYVANTIQYGNKVYFSSTTATVITGELIAGQSYQWHGYYDNHEVGNMISSDWAWAGGYNSSFTTAEGVAIDVNDLLESNGANMTAGHDDLYMCLVATYNGATYKWLGIDSPYTSLTTPCIHFFWNGSAFEASDLGGSDYNTTTIDRTTPTNGATVATSSTHTIGAHGYLSSLDSNGGSELTIHIENSNVAFQQCADVICSQIQHGSIRLDYTYPLVVYGVFNYSSSTGNLPIGKYWVTSTIRKGTFCFLGTCLYSAQVYSTSTTFTIATTTKADRLKTATQDYISSLTSTDQTFNNCSITDLNLFICATDIISYSFVPTPDAMSATVSRVRNEVFRKAPFGYVTRLVDIITATSTTDLPNVEIPIIWADSQDHLSVATSTMFQPADMLTGGAQVMDSIKDPWFNKGFQDVFSDLIKAIVAMSVILTIASDMLGMRHAQSSSTPNKKL